MTHSLTPTPREPNGLQVKCTRCEKRYPSERVARLEECRERKD